MKTLFLTVLTLFGLSARAVASGQPTTNPESCIVAPVLAQKLPVGIWVGKNANGQNLSVVFYESGHAQWNSAEEIKLYNWEAVAGVGGCASVYFTDPQYGTGSSYTVGIARNQLQLFATDLSGVSLKRVTAQEGLKKRQLLSGAWGNSTYPFEVARQQAPDMKEAYLQYRFSKDGAFVRKLGNSKRQWVETGAYLVSDDGNYVLLQFDTGCVTVVALKYLQFDELVLQHVLRCEDPAFVTGRKDFYFNKI